VALALLGAATGRLGAATARARGSAELAVASATVVAVAAQGHAVGIAPVPLSASLTVAHVVAAAAWGTALVVLDGRARRGHADPDGVAAAVRRWSPWGMVAVVVLAASGAALVWERVGPDQLLESTYGRLSLAKAALLVVAVVIAGRNRWQLADTPDRLARSVRIEIVVLALALVAGAGLAQVRPPELTGVGGDGGAFEQRLAFGDGQVELTVEPGRRGTNEMHITATGADGRLMAGIDDLRLELTLPSEDLGPLEPDMIPITSGHAMSYAEIPLAGTWTIEVISRPTKFEEYRASFEVPVGN
jgi:copper transport protein